MLSFFSRRGSSQQQQKQTTPVIREPPPPSSARREKEEKWLASISNNGSSTRKHQQPITTATFNGGNTNLVASSSAASSSAFASNGDAVTTRSLRPASSAVSLRSVGTTHSKRKLSIFSSSKSKPSSSPNANDDKDQPHTSTSPRTRQASSNSAPAGSSSFPSPSLASFSQPPPPPVPKLDPATKTLAERLQELSVAHGEGLLDDEEYRLMRTQVFQQMSTNFTTASPSSSSHNGPTSLVTTASQLPSSLSKSSTLSPDRARQPPPFSSSDPSTNGEGGKASSIHSTASRARSVKSMFRRFSSAKDKERERSVSAGSALGRATVEDSDWDVVHPSRPDVYDTSRRGMAVTSPTERLSPSSVSSSTFAGSGTRSIRDHPSLVPSSAALMRGFSTSSSRGAGGGGSDYGGDGGSSLGALSPTLSISRGGGSTYRSSISRGGRSVVGSSSSTQGGGGWSQLPPLASSSDPLVFASTSKEPTATELKNEIKNMEDELSRMEESWDGIERAAIAKRERERELGGDRGFALTSPISSPLLVIQSSSSPSPNTHSFGSIGLGRPSTTSQRPALPLLWEEDAPSNSYPSRTSAQSTAAADVEDLRRRRRLTEEKYRERLDFLRARLQAALIKEKLPR
ncbi:hypothetical protein T439DRAFT_322508 [Meredithblackwellia eburnea MCA 4105]